MKSAIGAATVLFLATVTTLIVLNRAEPVGTIGAVNIHDLGFTLRDLQRFTIVEEFGQHYQKGVHTIAAESENETLRIRIFGERTKAEAEQYIKGQSVLFESQYDASPPPYPELITNQTGCEEESLPTRVSRIDGVMYLAGADESFNYGLCAEELTKYRAALGIFYCPYAQKIFQIEYFAPRDYAWDTVNESISSFECIAE